MDIKPIVAQVLALDSVKNASSWNTDSVLHLAFEVAVIVKQASGASKVENIATLVLVLNDVIDELKAKEIASLDQEKATVVAAHYDALKATVDSVLPAVFANLPHLEVPTSWKKAFSCCAGSAVVTQVEAALPLAVDTSVSEKIEHVVQEVTSSDAHVATEVQKD